MEKVVFAGYNALNRKIIPWHPQLEKLSHITKIRAAFNKETKKFRVLGKLAKSNEDEVVKTSISAKDIQEELAAQEQAKLAKQEEEAAVLAALQEDEGPNLEEMQAAADDKPSKSKKFTAPKVGL